MIPATYAQSAPARNDVLAPSVIAVAYCGYCWATCSALENDLVSCAWTLLVIGIGVRVARERGRHGGRVAGGQQRAEDRLHERAAEVALEVGRPRRHARHDCTGTDPVSECEAGVPAKPTPMPTKP